MDVAVCDYLYAYDSALFSISILFDTCMCVLNNFKLLKRTSDSTLETKIKVPIILKALGHEVFGKQKREDGGI